MFPRRFFVLCALASCAQLYADDRAGLRPRTAATEPPPIDHLIRWLFDRDRELHGIDFSDVILAATGKKVIAFDPASEADRRMMRALTVALDEATKRMNAPQSAVQAVPRINEVSSHVEDLLRELLNASAELTCELPRTAEGHIQRSGYPDLRIVDNATARVYYLDPKLYAAGSRESSFRTFYFEPRIATNKVREDAVHLLVGFEHEVRNAGRWNFTRWDLVDLSHFKVRLKAEFQGSNRDIYRPEAIIGSSAK
jgi:hypothetical protein